ncbi:uncharacterized protein CLUP02_10674 [Colletotrichum lupini]|uniref:Uncharacterized protein n=1 Tax=Colletotrichum lupini TaxID=145971 RepID=A0A9Q8WIS5_9PEZI|nr:uncharacterized protein CLUP02_10674 [Colletotrichum lupini]UQC85178.1 hypothetical protein CLUP02_10674 [Colletotrichum lupini]
MAAKEIGTWHSIRPPDHEVEVGTRRGRTPCTILQEKEGTECPYFRIEVEVCNSGRLLFPKRAGYFWSDSVLHCPGLQAPNISSLISPLLSSTTYHSPCKPMTTAAVYGTEYGNDSEFTDTSPSPSYTAGHAAQLATTTSKPAITSRLREHLRPMQTIVSSKVSRRANGQSSWLAARLRTANWLANSTFRYSPVSSPERRSTEEDSLLDSHSSLDYFIFVAVGSGRQLGVWNSKPVAAVSTSEGGHCQLGPVSTGCRGHSQMKDTTVTGNAGRRMAAWNFGSRLRIKQRLPRL